MVVLGKVEDQEALLICKKERRKKLKLSLSKHFNKREEGRSSICIQLPRRQNQYLEIDRLVRELSMFSESNWNMYKTKTKMN